MLNPCDKKVRKRQQTGSIYVYKFKGFHGAGKFVGVTACCTAAVGVTACCTSTAFEPLNDKLPALAINREKYNCCLSGKVIQMNQLDATMIY